MNQLELEELWKKANRLQKIIDRYHVMLARVLDSIQEHSQAKASWDEEIDAECEARLARANY